MESITEPGTIDRLVADATSRGHQASVRLIRDWTELGLLDYPQRRPAGKGHGSYQALYSANQRGLFLCLLHHRPRNKIKSLARIPVSIWMYWGDDYVPTSQARRAMITWVGDPRASKKRARQTAQEILRRLDNPSATASARRELLNALTDIAYMGRADYKRLERAVREVFEPGTNLTPKAVGHPAAPLMTDSVIDLTKARLKAIGRLRDDNVTDEEFRQSRHAHLVTYAEYAMQQPSLAVHTAGTTQDMYEPVTAETALINSCDHLLTIIGLSTLYPEQTARLTGIPVPRIVFTSTDAK